MKDGQVAEMGSHEQLMQKKGLYHGLVTSQTGGGDEDEKEEEEEEGEEEEEEDEEEEEEEEVKEEKGEDEVLRRHSLAFSMLVKSVYKHSTISHNTVLQYHFVFIRSRESIHHCQLFLAYYHS